MSGPATGGPERELLCLGARTVLDGRARQSLATLAHGPVDWELAWEQAQLHEVVALVSRNLEQSSARESVPEWWLEKGARRRFATALKNTALAGELIRLVGGLRIAGVEPVPVKGVVLAETVYQDLGVRPSIDLDVLVHPHDLPAARSALRELGFRQSAEHTFAALRHAYHDPAYLRDTGDLTVRLELHRALWAPTQFEAGDALFERTTDCDFRGTRIRALSPEDTLLHLAIHRTRSPLRLRFLCDVAETVRRYEAGLDWDGVVRLARGLGARTATATALALSRRLLGAPVPAGIEDDLGVGRLKAAMLERTCGERALFGPDTGDELLRRQHVMLRLLEQDGAGRIARNVSRSLVHKARARRFERRHGATAQGQSPTT